jgi:hypothetical protein
MTVDTYHPNNGITPSTAVDQSSRGVAKITQWAEAAQAAHQLAEALCRTSFCPEQFRNNPVEATAAILAGGEVGLSPLAALNGFDIIQGRSAARAITLRAVVLSFGHEVELLESTSARCRMRGRRRGSEAWQEVEWPLQRAQQLGLTNKSNWKSQPTAMLQARATSEICRLVAADAILGIAYAAEELQDALDEKPATGPRKVQRQKVEPKAIPQATDTAEDDDLLGPGEPSPEPQKTSRVAAGPQGEEESGADSGFKSQPSSLTPATPEQLRALGITWSRIGVTDNLERHTLTGLMVGRDIGDTTKNLTVTEASQLLDKLSKIKDREQLEKALPDDAQPSLDDQDPPF